MHNRIAGAILFGASGLAATIGAVGYCIVLGLVAKSRYDSQFYNYSQLERTPATLGHIVVVAVFVLAVPGMILMIRVPKEA
jgi:hypothetical protein